MRRKRVQAQGVLARGARSAPSLACFGWLRVRSSSWGVGVKAARMGFIPRE